MIYLDTSVALAQLFAEDRKPAPQLWQQPLVSSRLLTYELWGRVHARGLGAAHAAATRGLIDRVALLELVPPVLARALEPMPGTLRTLDALHLASACFLRDQGQALELATYDERMASAARRLGLVLSPLTAA